MANFEVNPITGQLDLVGASASYINGTVATPADLPVTVGNPALDSVYLAKAGSGLWLINRKPAGLYCRVANDGDLDDWTYLGAFPEVNADGNWALYNSATPSKELKFDLSGISASTTRTLTVPDASGTIALTSLVGASAELVIACSDEATNLTTGTAKVTFRMPYAMTLSSVRASVNTAPTGSTLVVDINEGGSTILSTKLSIDASELTSTTAATAAVISDTGLADDAEITIDIDQIGSTVAGKGLKVVLKGTRA
jgi:hypothetical protein